MTTRQRPADLGVADARRICAAIGRELADARHMAAMSQASAAVRAGTSQSQWGRLERGELRRPTFELVCRACRAVGLAPAFKAYPAGPLVRDAASLALMARFEVLPAPPLRMRREVPIPLAGDLRAWDARIEGREGNASIEAESRIHDAQALERRIALKVRDDPGAGVVILVVNDTAHNRRVLAEHREALRAQLPLDGSAIARALRAGRIPPASGIVML
jgi:transcriptional regulator with XRE-family HTH domain